MDSKEFKEEFNQFINDCELDTDNKNLFFVDLEVNYRIYHSSGDLTARYVNKSNKIVVFDNNQCKKLTKILKDFKTNHLKILCKVKESKICKDLNMIYVVEPMSFISSDTLNMIKDCWDDFNLNYLDNQYDLKVNNEWIFGFDLYLSVDLYQSSPSDIFNENLDRYNRVLTQTIHLLESDGYKSNYTTELRCGMDIPIIENRPIVDSDIDSNKISRITVYFFGDYPNFY
jgi:hypothetical protein